MIKELSPQKAALQRAADQLGGQAALAEALGFKDRRNVWPWFKTDRSVPVEHCAAIERITNGAVTRQELRPDDWQAIWPELSRPKQKKEGAA